MARPVDQALRIAAYEGDLEKVELLLAKKRDAMDLDSALHGAVAKKGNLAVTERLVAAGARATWVHPDVDPSEATTTRMKALHPQPEALPLFLGHPYVHVIDAAIDGDLDAVKRFLAEGASPDCSDIYKQTTVLSAASRCGHTEVARLLLDSGASLYGPKKKTDPLFGALRGAHLETADLLWERGCRRQNMLTDAIRLDLPFESVRWAFDRKPEPNDALYDAARSKRIEVARFALERGADPSYRRHGRSSLMVAAMRRDVPMAELLIEAGANLHQVDGSGWTAMHYAVFIGDPDDPDEVFDTYPDDALDTPIAQLLLRHGLPIPPRG